MKIYIAASWKLEHYVELLTRMLEKSGHTVISFVRKAVATEHEILDKAKKGDSGPFEEWVWSDDGFEKFEYDTDGATDSDLVIYLSPSGTDAWAEVGAAWASGVPVMGLWSKGEQAGLMRRMVSWYESLDALMGEVEKFGNTLKSGHDDRL